MKFLAVNPFVRLVVPLITGILLQHQLRLEWSILAWATGIIITILILFPLLPGGKQFFFNWIRGLFLSLLFIAAGSALMKSHLKKRANWGDGKYTFQAEVLDIPREKPRSWQSTLKVKHYQLNGNHKHANAKILAYFQKEAGNAPVQPGDIVLASAYIHPIRNYGNPCEFDYQSYMASLGIHHQCYLQKNNWCKTANNSRSSVVVHANHLRNKTLKILHSGIDGENEQAIAAALLLGYKGLLTPDMKSRFSTSGTMHILAVSGLHVGIIYLILHHLLVFIDRYRYGQIIKTLVILLILAGYALFTGFSPSVCRATLMFAVITAGRAMHRKSSIYNSLAFSAFLLLTINPMLIFSVSFQLSYSAVASIAFFQPRIHRLIKLDGIPDKLWQWFTLAVAAQIGAAPLIIRYFHIFPTYFWLSNFIAVPAASAIIFTGIGYILTFALFDPLSLVFQLPLNFLLKLLTKTTGFIQSLPFTAAENLWISTTAVFFFYLSIGLLAAYLIRRKSGYLTATISLSIIFLLVNSRMKLQRQNQSELIIYNTGEISAINHLTPGKNMLYLSARNNPGATIAHHIKNYWLWKGVKTHTLQGLPMQNKNNPPVPPGSRHFFSAGNLHLAYLHGNMDFSQLHPAQRLSLDYIILAGDAQVTAEEIIRCFQVKTIVLDASNSWYQRHRWIKHFRKKGIQVHSIPEQGAFQVNIDQKLDKKIGLL